MYFTADLFAAEHQKDLLREADAERLAALVRGARRSPWTLFLGRLAGLLRGVAGSMRRGPAATRPAGPRPAAA